jgi:hypothetical protein
VLVTALNLDLGRWVWWPSQLARQPRPQAGIRTEPPSVIPVSTEPERTARRPEPHVQHNNPHASASEEQDHGTRRR